MAIALIENNSIFHSTTKDFCQSSIEELVHHRYELPVFTTLVRAAKQVRGTVDTAFYRPVRQSLNDEDY